MAEIKSTMELVLERAARMGTASSDDIEKEEAKKKGMRLAAAFLDGKGEALAQVLAAQPPAGQEAVRAGMAEGLLRNLFLPRDEHAIARTEQAARGLIDLAGGAGDIVTMCQELQHVIGQYQQHREQLKGQLEEQLRMQMEQAMAAQQMGGGRMDGLGQENSVQAKVQEEWARLEGELDGQYNQALDQYKEQIRLRLGL
jgi:hypothetical protein